MGLYIGDRKFNDLHRGGEPIGAVYQGTSKIWSRPPQGEEWGSDFSLQQVLDKHGITNTQTRLHHAQSTWPDLEITGGGFTDANGHLDGYRGKTNAVSPLVLAPGYSGKNFQTLTSNLGIHRTTPMRPSPLIAANFGVRTRWETAAAGNTLDAFADLEIPGYVRYRYRTKTEGTLYDLTGGGGSVSVPLVGIGSGPPPGIGIGALLSVVISGTTAHVLYSVGGEGLRSRASIRLSNPPPTGPTMRFYTETEVEMGLFSTKVRPGPALSFMGLFTGSKARAKLTSYGATIPEPTT